MSGHLYLACPWQERRERWFRNVLIFTWMMLLAAVPISLTGIPYQVARYALTSGVIAFGFLVGYRFLDPFSGYVKLSLLIISISTIVGAININRFNGNSFSEWAEYTLLYFCSAMAFQIGWTVSALRSQAIMKQLANIALADFAGLIAKFASVGLLARSSLGITPLITYALEFYRNKRRGGVVTSWILLALHSITAVMSGMRSLMMIPLVNAFWFFGGRWVALLSLAALIGLTAIGMQANFFSNILPGSAVSRGAFIIETRFQQTLFSQSGPRLDPNEGRADESEFAIIEFNRAQSEWDLIFGRGYGFVFVDYIIGPEETAHIHLTPVAAYVREGVFGVIRYAWIIIWVGAVFFQRIRRRDPRAWEGLVSVVLILFSLISGYLLDPLYWIFIGYSLRPSVTEIALPRSNN